MEVDNLTKHFIQSEDLNKFFNICTKKINLNPRASVSVVVDDYSKCMDKIVNFMKFVNDEFAVSKGNKKN